MKLHSYSQKRRNCVFCYKQDKLVQHHLLWQWTMSFSLLALVRKSHRNHAPAQREFHSDFRPSLTHSYQYQQSWSLDRFHSFCTSYIDCEWIVWLYFPMQEWQDDPGASTKYLLNLCNRRWFGWWRWKSDRVFEWVGSFSCIWSETLRLVLYNSTSKIANDRTIDVFPRKRDVMESIITNRIALIEGFLSRSSNESYELEKQNEITSKFSKSSYWCTLSSINMLPLISSTVNCEWCF